MEGFCTFNTETFKLVEQLQKPHKSEPVYQQHTSTILTTSAQYIMSSPGTAHPVNCSIASPVWWYH